MRTEAEQELGKVYDVALLRWVWSFVRPYRHLFLLSAVLMPLDTLFLLAQPYLIKLTIDLYLTRHRSVPPGWLAALVRLFGGNGLLAIGLCYALLVIGEFVTNYGQFYVTMIVAQLSLSDLRLALFRHVETMPTAFFDRQPIGRLVSRLTSDIETINDMFGAGSLTIFVDVPDAVRDRRDHVEPQRQAGAGRAVRDTPAVVSRQLLPSARPRYLPRDPRPHGGA